MEWNTGERALKTEADIRTEKDWASSVGLCKRHKPQRPHHVQSLPTTYMNWQEYFYSSVRYKMRLFLFPLLKIHINRSLSKRGGRKPAYEQTPSSHPAPSPTTASPKICSLWQIRGENWPLLPRTEPSPSNIGDKLTWSEHTGSTQLNYVCQTNRTSKAPSRWLLNSVVVY